MNCLKYALLIGAVFLAACGDDSSTSASDVPKDSAKTSYVTTSYLNPDYSYGEMTDARDGQVYKTTTIGSQTWLAQNLNYETTNSACFNNVADSCAKYGRLYSWNDAKKACPSGWHLPDTTEWNVLLDEVGGKDSATVNLISKNGWPRSESAAASMDSIVSQLDSALMDRIPKGWGGSDPYGFSALPAGQKHKGGDFMGVGGMSDFWLATEYLVNLFGDSVDEALYANLLILGYYVYVVQEEKTSFKSVRCVKD